MHTCLADNTGNCSSSCGDHSTAVDRLDDRILGGHACQSFLLSLHRLLRPLQERLVGQVRNAVKKQVFRSVTVMMTISFVIWMCCLHAVRLLFETRCCACLQTLLAAYQLARRRRNCRCSISLLSLTYAIISWWYCRANKAHCESQDDFIDDIFVPLALAAATEALLGVGVGMGLVIHHTRRKLFATGVVKSAGSVTALAGAGLAASLVAMGVAAALAKWRYGVGWRYCASAVLERCSRELSDAD
jgi:hypothetical protein